MRLRKTSRATWQKRACASEDGRARRRKKEKGQTSLAARMTAPALCAKTACLAWFDVMRAAADDDAGHVVARRVQLKAVRTMVAQRRTEWVAFARDCGLGGDLKRQALAHLWPLGHSPRRLSWELQDHLPPAHLPVLAPSPLRRSAERQTSAAEKQTERHWSWRRRVRSRGRRRCRRRESKEEDHCCR
jgi:hypothetical protein